jgi:hypothetical protein
MEPATCRVVAQCLNQVRHPVPPVKKKEKQEVDFFCKHCERLQKRRNDTKAFIAKIL